MSHFAGAALAAFGTLALLALSSGRPERLASFAVYGASLVVLYLASGLYHAVRKEASWLQKLDHLAIYLLIAGTYVPLCVIALPGAWGLWMLVAEAAMAVLGMAAIVFLGGGPKWLRLVLYLAMGWLAVGAIGPLSRSLSPSGLRWLLAGGIVYSLGTIVYASKRPKLWPGSFGSHELWHLFVLAGSACHFLVMLELARLPGA